MRARHRGLPGDTCPPKEAYYIVPKQTFLSLDKEYEVYAVSVYDGIAFLLVVDDDSTASFYPRTLFDVVESRVPTDWICNAFPTGPVQLILGPSFIAKDLASYDGMVDQRREQFDEFWRRIFEAPDRVD